MSIYKEISESHDVIKSIGLSSLISPFWFLSLFLFNINLYNNSDLIIKIVLCLLLSLSSVIVFLVFAYNIEKPRFNLLDSVSASLVFLGIWKAILIFIIYSVYFFFKTEIYFYWYIVIYFTPIITLSILSFFEKVKSKLK